MERALGSLDAPAFRISEEWAFEAAFGYAASLSVNGEVRQDAVLSGPIWPVPQRIADLSCCYHLGPGTVRPGDRITGPIDGLEVRIAPTDVRHELTGRDVGEVQVRGTSMLGGYL